MTRSVYPAAQAVAPTVADYFSKHLAAARSKESDQLAPAPDAHSIEAIIDAAFWASLRREENYS
ncbi:MAG TPA: hypothetical protein VIV66_13625, partial [Pyrinomonadaceae bacterium]